MKNSVKLIDSENLKSHLQKRIIENKTQFKNKDGFVLAKRIINAICKEIDKEPYINIDIDVSFKQGRR